MNKVLLNLLLPLAMSTTLVAGPAAQVGEVRIVGPSQSYLGVMIMDVTADDAARLRLPREEGVLVEEVTANSPASRAGLETGDVIYEYAGIPVISGQQFRRLISETPVGRKLEMKVWRDGTPITIDATIEARESLGEGRHHGNAFTFRVPQVHPDLRSQGIFVQRRGPTLGIEGARLTDQMAQFLGIPGKEGVLVLEVQADTPAAAAGLKAGDVILSVNGGAVHSPSELADSLSRGKVELEVARGQQTLKLEADLGPKAESDAETL